MSNKWKHAGKSSQRKAALKRKLDAECLSRSGSQHASGAMYLGGYAIECKIKAIAMEVHGCDNLDQLRQKLSLTEERVYRHGLESLFSDLLPNGTSERLHKSEAAGAFMGQVNRWSPQ